MTINIILKDEFPFILSAITPRTRYHLGRLRSVNSHWNKVIIDIMNNFVYNGRFPLQIIPKEERGNFINKNSNKIIFLKLSQKANIRNFLSQIPHLKSLHLKNCHQLNDEDLKVVFNLHRLSTLTITGHETHKITQKAFINISEKHELKSLTIRDCNWISSYILKKISNFKNLSHLDVGKTSNLFIEELNFPEEKFKNLSSLTIHSNKINDDNFANFFKSSNLTYLDITTNQISDSTFNRVPVINQLSILKLNFCKITNTGLKLIPYYFPNLSLLCLNHCDQITEFDLTEQYSNIKISIN